MPTTSSPSILPLPLHQLLAVAGCDAIYQPLRQQFATDTIVRLTTWDVTQTSHNFDDWLAHHQPEVILLHAPSLQTAGIECLPLCQWLRQHPSLATYRPIIVVHSAPLPAANQPESDDPCLTTATALARPSATLTNQEYIQLDATASQTMAWLAQGADDVLPLPLSASAELRTRLLAHFRRLLEYQRHPSSQLPNAAVLGRILSRALAPSAGQTPAPPWSLLWLQLNPWQTYSHTCGPVATKKALHTALVACQKVLRAGEWLFHVEDATLAIVSPRHHADKLARLICKQFDQSRAMLHYPDDLERGFMVCPLKGGLQKQPLLHINVGVVNSIETSLSDVRQVMLEGQTLASHSAKQLNARSGWLKHSPSLNTHPATYGSASTASDTPLTPKALVWVVEPDAALAYLLTTTLNYQGLKVDAAMDNAEVISWLASPPQLGQPVALPHVVLLDAVNSPLATVEHCCKQLKRLAIHAKVVVATTLPEMHEALLGMGAHWLVSKPYDVMWLMNLLQELA